jgi:hypothetical protein
MTFAGFSCLRKEAAELCELRRIHRNHSRNKGPLSYMIATPVVLTRQQYGRRARRRERSVHMAILRDNRRHHRIDSGLDLR